MKPYPIPICAKCAKAMLCVKNEFIVRDCRTEDSEATVWFGDRFECQKCKASVIVGFGNGVIESNLAPEFVEDALEFTHNRR